MAIYPAAYWAGNTRGTTLDTAQTHTLWHDEEQAEIKAIQTAAGLTPQGTDATMKARFDRIDALAARCGVKARRNANQTLAATALTVISFDLEDEDTNGFFAPPSTNLTVPAGKAGVYSITARTFAAAAKSPPSYIMISVGATDFQFASVGSGLISGSITLPLVVGNVVTVSVYNSGAADGSTSAVWMYRVSA